MGNIPTTDFKVTDLTPGSRYDFRVKAKNTAGAASQPSENTGPIVCKEEYGKLSERQKNTEALKSLFGALSLSGNHSYYMQIFIFRTS